MSCRRYARARITPRARALAIAPAIAQIIVVALILLFNPGATLGGIGGAFVGDVQGTLFSMLTTAITSFGLAVSIILADTIWRQGRGSPRDAWSDARNRRGGDIVLAAMGFSFVQWVASLVGGLFAGLGLVLVVVAIYLFLYALPAAAIGGVPGGMSLQLSLERTKRNYLNTAILAAIYIAITFFLDVPALSAAFFVQAFLVSLLPAIPFVTLVITTLIVTLIKAVALGYFTLVLARGYADISYGRYG